MNISAIAIAAGMNLAHDAAEESGLQNKSIIAQQLAKLQENRSKNHN
jgi:hypothetical protein